MNPYVLLNSHLGRAAVGAVVGAGGAALYNQTTPISFLSDPVTGEPILNENNLPIYSYDRNDINPLHAAAVGATLGLGSRVVQNNLMRRNTVTPEVMRRNTVTPEEVEMASARNPARERRVNMTQPIPPSQYPFVDYENYVMPNSGQISYARNPKKFPYESLPEMNQFDSRVRNAPIIPAGRNTRNILDNLPSMYD